MLWLLAALTVILLAILLILLTRVSITFSYSQVLNDVRIQVAFKMWYGLIRYKLDIPSVKMEDFPDSVVVEEKIEKGKDQTVSQETINLETENMLVFFEDIKSFVGHIAGFHKIVRYFLKKVSLYDLQWNSVIGIGEAAHTGVMAGSFWALKSGVLTLLSRYIRLRTMPSVSITPHFQLMTVQTSIKCMIRFRIGHAILAGMKMVKFWKAGWPEFKSRPFSGFSSNKAKSV